MKISFACDHAGFALKKPVINFLKQSGYEVIDCGTDSEESVDYPDFAAEAAVKVRDRQAEYAIVICGSGIGVSITANKINGVRCALCMNEEMAELSRKHNNANALAMGARLISQEVAINIVDRFLKTGFEGGRHLRRVQKIHTVTNC